MNAAAFLDRDGVINEDRGYVHKWMDFTFLPGAIDALRRLQHAGFLLVIVTNQSGIGRGYYTESDYAALTACMLDALRSSNVTIHGVYHCPHAPFSSIADATCACRKPLPGLIERALADLPIARSKSFIIGDKASDIAAGRAAKLAAAYQVGDGRSIPSATARFPDLARCVDDVLAASATQGESDIPRSGMKSACQSRQINSP